MKPRKYCLVGAGGFAKEALWCLKDTLGVDNTELRANCVFMVQDQYYNDANLLGVPIIKQSEFDPSSFLVTVAIGDPYVRNRIVKSLPSDTVYNSIIHPSARVSNWVRIGEGTIVCAGTIITCNIIIGKHCHLNLNTTIGHDCHIGDYFTTAPGVNISGNCTIGDKVYFGTNSATREKTTICNDVTVGMSSNVLENINESGVYFGNPAKKSKLELLETA